MTTKRVISIIGLIMVTLVASACDETAVRQLALQLRSSVAEDEELVDKQIARQLELYENQQELINNSREQNKKLEFEAARRMRSAEVASAISSSPQTGVRLSTIMNYLHESHDKEFELWKRVNADQQAAREGMSSRIAKLQRQKKVLTQIKKNLDQLAVKGGNKKRAAFILKFSRDTYLELKKSMK